MIRIVLMLLCTVSSIGMLISQQSIKRQGTLELMLYGQYGPNIYIASFEQLPGIPSCCSEFSQGYGSGPSIGLGLGYYVSDDWLLGLRSGYRDLSALFEEKQPIDIIIDGIPAMGEFTHFIDVTLTGLEIYPHVAYKVTDKLNFYMGPAVTFVGTAEHDHKEVITNPADRGTFVGADLGRRIRNDTVGLLPDAASLLFSIEVGASYEFPMNESGSLVIVPELFTGYGLNSPVEGLDWSIITIRGGLSLRYGMWMDEKENMEPIIRDTVYIRDTMLVEVDRTVKPLYRESRELSEDLIEEKGVQIVTMRITEKYISEYRQEEKTDTGKGYNTAISIKAVGIDEDGIEKPLARIKLKEYISTEIRPLLPYIFFEKDSSSLPQQYQKNGVNTMSQVYAPEVYYRVLDTVADRVTRAGGRIELIGSYTQDEREEVALRRTESVRDYFIQSRISSDKISIKTMKLEAEGKGVDSDIDLRKFDLRRVEIKTEGVNGTDVVFLRDTIKLSNPPRIRLYPRIESESITDWRIELYNEGRIVKSFSGTADVPESLVWHIEREQNEIIGISGDIDIVFEINSGNDRFTARNKIPFTQELLTEKRVEREGRYIIGRYELILFDFNSAELSQEHLKILDLIKKDLRPESKLVIEGFTDIIGDTQLNLRLAKRRAEAVANFFQGYDTVTKALGENIEFYDNLRPEGRMYSRTVRITARTPYK